MFGVGKICKKLFYFICSYDIMDLRRNLIFQLVLWENTQAKSVFSLYSYAHNTVEIASQQVRDAFFGAFLT